LGGHWEGGFFLNGQGYCKGKGDLTGHSYEGEIFQDRASGSWHFQGRGTYRFPDGSVQDGFWNQGQFVGATPPPTTEASTKKSGFWAGLKEGFKEGYRQGQDAVGRN
jgi:hypothetical protein